MTDDALGRWTKAALLLLVLIPTAFNAVALWPELSLPLPSLNDDAVHFLLAQRLSEAMAAGDNPFDHWAPELDLGFPQMLYYQHLPHLAVVLLHRLLFQQVDLLTIFNLVRYLLLIGLPLTVYWSMRQLGFPLVASAVGAACSSLISGNSRYGFEYDSYIWKGWGMYTQLWAVHLSLLTLACINRLLERGKGYVTAIMSCSALALSHLMYSYMVAPGVIVLLLVGVNRANVRARLARLAITSAAALVVTSYFWLPFLRYKAYLSASPYEAAWKYESFGAVSILTWLVNGDLFDYGRLPVLTLLAALGVAFAVVSRARPALLSLGLMLVWLVLFFGRPTLGHALDVLPMHERIHFHRFIGGVHLAAIFLMGLGGEWIWRQLAPVPARWRGAVIVAIFLGALAPAAYERYEGYRFNAELMVQTKQALDRDEDARTIIATLKTLPPGRVSAGRRDNWGKEVKLGSLYFFDLLSFGRFPTTTTYGTFSLNSDLIWHLDDKSAAHYDLFNIRYVVAPRGMAVPPFLRPIKETRRYILYRADTTGYATFATVSGTRANTSQAALFAENREWMGGAGSREGRYVRQDYPGGAAAGTADAAVATPGQTGCPGGGRIEEQLVQPGRYDFKVECPSAATVALKVSYHPNWKVTIDGRDTSTFMLSPSFIGIAVPPGIHEIRAEYRPTPYKTPLLLLGGLTLAAIVALRNRIPRLESLLPSGR